MTLVKESSYPISREDLRHQVEVSDLILSFPLIHVHTHFHYSTQVTAKDSCMMLSDYQDENGTITLHTERLKLRLADPDDDADCLEIIRLYTDPNAGKGGNSRTGCDSIAGVREKHRVSGPKAQYCTLAPPPKGMFFLVYLPSAGPGQEDILVGNVAISFRPEMPYPDLGYGILGPYEKQGYATEAGRRVLKFWRETIGVKEIWCGTLPGNEKSQRLAERIGFVRAGTINVVFGVPPDEELISGAVGFVLPGMEWTDGLTIYPTVR